MVYIYFVTFMLYLATEIIETENADQYFMSSVDIENLFTNSWNNRNSNCQNFFH